MSKLEELHTLVRLLKKFELPVSPILEYAIQNRIEELNVDNKNKINVSVIKAPKNSVTGKKKPSILRIVRSDNSIIECERAAITFSQVIKEIGVEKVYELKIPMDNMHIVTIGGNPQYPTAQYDVGNGYFVNVHSSTVTKKQQLERIFKALNLNWKVEIVEPK